jgi:hypothetical protein
MAQRAEAVTDRNLVKLGTTFVTPFEHKHVHDKYFLCLLGS